MTSIIGLTFIGCDTIPQFTIGVEQDIWNW